MSKQFIDINRNKPINVPENCDGWLGEKSLARFVVDIVEELDTSSIELAYSGGGSSPYPPKMMLALLFYCYANGIFSSRKIERATYELIPVIFITGGTHPDHDTVNTFRQRFLAQMGTLFVMLLQIAHTMGILKLGDISMDGTKIKANASKHKAMSWEYACKLEVQLQAEVEKLLKRAEADNGQNSDGQKIDIPAELLRREARLEKIKEIKTELEKRAAERYAQEQAAYEEKLRVRAEKELQCGRKLGGIAPKAPEPGPRAKDQANFTDGESRIMPTAGGAFEQAYNAQATVDMATMLIIGQHVSQNTNDKQEVAPALAVLANLPDSLGSINNATADSGYFSKENAVMFEDAGIAAYMPNGRQHHNPTLEERFPEIIEVAEVITVPEIIEVAEVITVPEIIEVQEVMAISEVSEVIETIEVSKTPEEIKAAKEAKAVATVECRMKTEQGKKLYAQRKSTVEPVFGIIKEAMGFRRFMLRGLDAVQGEWSLVCMAFNLKRLCVLNLA
jgi:transposase